VKPTRLVGHKLTVEFSGERSREERSSTGYCICGWSESASTQNEVRFEYRVHVKREIERRDRWLAEADARSAARRAAEMEMVRVQVLTADVTAHLRIEALVHCSNKHAVQRVLTALSTCVAHGGAHHFAVVGEGYDIGMTRVAKECLQGQYPANFIHALTGTTAPEMIE